ncbi:MAG: choice-of-anchor D domain-containing protein [Myxococcota bacterium]
MRPHVALASALVFASLAGTGCGDDTSGVSGDGRGDASISDIAFGDGATAPDTGTTSTSSGDTGTTSTSSGDTGTTSTSSGDTGATSTSSGDTGTTSTSTGDTSVGDAQTFTPSLFVDPTHYTFSYIAPLAASMTKQLTLFNTGSAPLDITAIEWAPGSSADFDIVLIPALPKRLAPGKDALLTVRFRDIEGGVGTLRITSTDPVNPVTTLTFDSYLKATSATPEPCVALVPNRLDFGTLQRGQQLTKSATLSNCGQTQPLVLKAVTRSQFFFIQLSQAFQITNLPPLPLTLQPGASLPIDVQYAPTLAGIDGGYFAFETDDPNQPKAQLDVSGVGTQPPLGELGLHIKIAWNTDDTDEDSHLIMPGGTFFDCFSDCYFGNPSPDWGTTGDWHDDPFLDVDDVDGYGPENINISTPQPGTYTFKVHYYADSHQGGSKPSDTTVEIWSYGTLLQSFGPTSTASTGWTWDVFTIDWPSGHITTLGNLWQVGSGVVQSCGFHFP